MPPDFKAVAAYRCDTFASVEDAEGRWLATTTERQEDDLAPLIAALDEPDDLAWLGPCAASLTIVPALWLENGDGDAVRVANPVDGGGQPKYARVKKARDRLMVAETISERGELQEPRVAIDTGCPAALDPVKVVGLEDLQGVPGLDVRNGLGSASPEFDRAVPQAVLVPPAVSTDEEINGMRHCRYGTAPDVGKTSTDMPLEMPGTGQLRDGRDLSVADGRAILAEAGNGTSALPCLQRATLFVALYPLIAHQPTAQPIVVGVLSLIRELDE